MDIYSENILEHYKNPKNFGSLPDPKISHAEKNSSCGDFLNLDLAIENGKIKKVAFSGNGCAISQAAMSMLTEILIGKTIKEAQKITEQDILKMLKIEITQSRLNCALLGLRALKNALMSKKVH